MKMNGRLLASSLTLFLVFFSNMVFAAASEAYKLGTGDRVKVMVYGQEDLTTEAEVAGDGTITMPLVGRVEIRGISAQEAGDLIGRQLEQRGYLKRAHVNLLIEQYRSNTVSMLGQVNHPGRIALEGPTSLTEALALAGGINDTGSERIILVKIDSEGRQSRKEFNLRELLDSSAEGRSPVTIEKGDTVYIPRADQFYVYGQVQKPGTYALDRPLNVMQALSVSGGFNPSASSSGLIIYRQQPDGEVEELEARFEDRIEDGDVLFVKESLF